MSVGRYVGLTAMLAVTTAGAVMAAMDLGPAARLAVGLGAGLAALNSVAAFVLALAARRKAALSAFMLMVVGGMAARMGLMLGAVAAALFWLKLPPTPLVASVMAYFALYLVLELVLLPPTPAAAEAR